MIHMHVANNKQKIHSRENEVKEILTFQLEILKIG